MNGLILPRVIGHRGLAARAPENTLAGFAEAARLGVGWIELDVQLTSDGVPVVFHDDRLERTTDGRGCLTETSFADLRRLDAGRWFSDRFAGQRVPSLAETLTFLIDAGLGLNLEIKASEEAGARTATQALSCLRALWPGDGAAAVVVEFRRQRLGGDGRGSFRLAARLAGRTVDRGLAGRGPPPRLPKFAYRPSVARRGASRPRCGPKDWLCWPIR